MRVTDMKPPVATGEEHFSYGKVYFDQKDYDQAIMEFGIALEQSPDNSNIMISLGRCRLARKEYEDALRDFGRAAELAPNFADAHFYLGQTLLELNKRDKAINEFKEALNINPRYKAARDALGTLLTTISKTHRGKESETDSSADEEDNISRQANTHFHLGNALMQKNLLQESIAEFKEAIRLRPNYPDIRNRLGELYMQRGLYNLAEEELKLALKINPRYATALLNLGDCYRMHSEQLIDQAGEMYERVIESDPENSQALRGLDNVRGIKRLIIG